MKSLILSRGILVIAFLTLTHAVFAAGGGNVGKDHQIIHIGGGETIIALTDIRGDTIRRVYVQKLDASGAAQWTADGVALSTNTSHNPQLVSDGSGGAIVCWQEQRPNYPFQVYAQRVNGSGTAQWAAGGVRACTAISEQKNPQIVSDTTGGAILVWEDWRNIEERQVYAQRLDSSGVRQWADDGVQVSTLTPGYVQNPMLVVDGSGGAIAVWMRGFRVFPDTFVSIYAQRISSAGALQWNSGVEVIVAAASVPSSPSGDVEWLNDVASDGSGGVIVGWQGWGTDLDVLAKRLDSTGTQQWVVTLTTAAGEQRDISLDADGSGGAFLAWTDLRNGTPELYAQSVNAAGAIQWASGGVAVAASSATREHSIVASDGGGGMLIVWEQDEDIYAKRLDATGSPASGWGADGVIVCSAAGEQGTPVLVTDGSSGLIAAWWDNRVGNAYGLFGQRVTDAGATAWAGNGIAVVSTGVDLAANYRVRLDFEDIGDNTVVSDQCMGCGLEFQLRGSDGTPSFVTTQVAPFGNVNSTDFPPLKLTELVVSMYGTVFAQNIRYFNLEQTASHVFFWVNSGQAAPASLWTRIRAYDGLNGTGTELFSHSIPRAPLQFIEIDTVIHNIKSLTIQNVGNRADFDYFTFDSAATPKGGYLDITSNLDGSATPELYLDGVRGDPYGESPAFLISIPSGDHVVELYSPGHEPHYETVSLIDGVTTTVNATLVPAVEPEYETVSLLQSGGSDMDVGNNATPQLGRLGPRWSLRFSRG